MKRIYRSIRTLVVTALVAALSASAAWAIDSGATLSKSERVALWSRNIDLFEHIRDRSDGVAGLNPDAAVLRDPRVAEWVKDLNTKLAEQEERRAEDFARYVERAKGHLDKNEIREALVEANRAYRSAVDQDVFRKSDWVVRLTDASLAYAEDLRAEADWRKAYEVYYNLCSIFEGNKDFEKARDDCLTYARLDAVYEEDDNWEERLEDITPMNALDALDKIDRNYVEEGDFRAVTESGLENLLLICDSKVMAETFSGLADEYARGDFRARVTELLKRVRRSDRFNANDAKGYFRRAVKINSQTVDLPEALVVYEFMAGALGPLDEFTSMIWPIEFKEFDKHTRGDFVGVGISITGGGDREINVVSPLAGTPAYRAGVLPEDKITHVNGQSLKGISLTKAVRMITGPIGTEVKLTIRRPSEGRSFDVTLMRDKIEIQSVMGFQRDPDDPEKWDYLIDKEMGIGYVHVLSFQDNTEEQLRKAIDDAMEAGARGLVLDLRFNPGGLLKSAVEVTRLFQASDEEVVSTRGLRDRPWAPPQTSEDGSYMSLPLIVLVNEYSASASEIVSGALEDNDRAIVLGDRTYGKFSVQKLMELRGGMAHLKLTTARYYLPEGRSLHHEEGASEWGVAPDVFVKLYPKEVLRVRIMQQDRDVLVRADAKNDQAGGSAEGTEAEEGSQEGDEEASAEGDDVSSEPPVEQESAVEPEADDSAPEGDTADETDDDEDEDKLNLAEDPNEVPDVDLQLDTALLLMRLHLLGEDGLELASGAEKSLPDQVQRP